MSRSWLMQPKTVDRLINIAPRSSFFCDGLIASFLLWKEVHFGYTLTESALISQKIIFKKVIYLSFVNFWNIWKNTDWSVVTFFLSTIFFVQGKHLRFFKVFKVCSVFDVLIKIKIILSEKKPLKLLINFVGISVNCSIFLGSNKLIIFVILSFRTCWKEKEEFKFCIIFLIEIMLGWFWYLAIAFSIGSFSFSVFIMKLWLVFIPKVGTMFTKKLLKSSLILYHCLQFFRFLLFLLILSFWRKGALL